MEPDDFPEGSILIEIRGIYDGWSAVKLPTGEIVNRWPKGDRRHQSTQDWIDLNSQAFKDML